MTKQLRAYLPCFVLLILVLLLAGCKHEPPKYPDKDPDAKIPIESPSQLTDETTGKGVISLGDSVDDVMIVLEKYKPSFGDMAVADHNKNKYGESFWFGDVLYSFDTKGRLIGYSSCNGGGPFVTSKGLKIGDSLSKVFDIYGKDYDFNGGSTSSLPCYIYSFENTVMPVTVQGNSRSEKDMSAVVIAIGCGLKETEN